MNPSRLSLDRPRPGPVLWPLVAGAVLLGCRSTLEPRTGDLARDLRHRDPRIRVLGARDVVAEGRWDLAPLLIENLRDSDEGVRFWTAIALRKLTGEDFGFEASAPEEERARAVDRWREWARDSGAGGGPGPGEGTARSPEAPSAAGGGEGSPRAAEKIAEPAAALAPAAPVPP